MKVTLGSVASYINGFAFKPTDWSTCGLKIIRIQNLTNPTSEANYYSGTYDLKYEVNRGDVLISWSASLGIYIWQDEKAVLNQHIFKVVFDKVSLNKKYFFYQVSYILKRAESETHGATMKHLTRPVFNALPFELPSMEQQNFIANELDIIARLINAHKRQLHLLDELVKSRFVEMFGSVKTNSMNWPIVEIGNIIEKLEAGWSGSGQQRDKKSGEIAVLKVSSVTQGYFIPEECKVLDNQKNIKKYIFPQKGDLLFSRANTREMVGATAIIMMDYPELILPDKLWKIQFKDNANVFYMKQVLSSTCIRKRFSAVSTGTSGSMYNVSMDKFKKIDIPLPPVNLQEKFAEFIIDIHKSRLLFKCQLLQYHNIEHIIRGRNYGEF